MSAVKRISPASHLALVEGVRGFRLVVKPGRGEAFGVTLEESYREYSDAITAQNNAESPAIAGRIMDVMIDDISKAVHQQNVLAINRKSPIRLADKEANILALEL